MRPTGRIVGLDQREKPKQRAYGKYFQAKADCIGTFDRKELMHAIPDLVRFCYVYDDDTYVADLATHREYFGSEYQGGCELAAHMQLWHEPEFNGAVSVWREPTAGRLFETHHHTAASYQAMLNGYPLYRELRDPSTTPAGRLMLHARLRELAAGVPAPPGIPSEQQRIEPLPEIPVAETETYYKLMLLGRDPTAPVGLLRRRIWAGGMTDETLRRDLTWQYSPALTAYCRGDLYLTPHPIGKVETRALTDVFGALQKSVGERPEQ